MPGEVRRGEIPFGGSRVPVHTLQAHLVAHRAHRRSDSDRLVETLKKIVCDVRRKLHGPGTCTTPVVGQILIDVEALIRRKTHEGVLRAELIELSIVTNALKAITVRHRVLVHEHLARSLQRCWHHQPPVVVVDFGQYGGADRRFGDRITFGQGKRRRTGQRGGGEGVIATAGTARSGRRVRRSDRNLRPKARDNRPAGRDGYGLRVGSVGRHHHRCADLSQGRGTAGRSSTRQPLVVFRLGDPLREGAGVSIGEIRRVG